MQDFPNELAALLAEEQIGTELLKRAYSEGRIRKPRLPAETMATVQQYTPGTEELPMRRDEAERHRRLLTMGAIMTMHHIRRSWEIAHYDF